MKTIFVASISAFVFFTIPLTAANPGDKTGYAVAADEAAAGKTTPAAQAPGQSNWSPFRELPYRTKSLGNSYFSIILPDRGGVELWSNTWGPQDAADHTFFVRRGPGLDKLGPEEPVFDSTLIADVFDLKLPQLAAGRGLTRPSLIFDPQEGYVLFCGVCPEYLPGEVPLIPALFVSKTGEKGTWEYLGKLKGEPAAEVERRLEQKQYTWTNGGSIIRLTNGLWRIYVTGFGPRLAVLESDNLHGPWRFLRNGQNQIREILACPGDGAIFPHLLKIPGGDWHLWLTDTWPAKAIWHFISTDGLKWQMYGRQPEITQATVGGRDIKCLRAHYDAGQRKIVGLLSVWCDKDDGSKCWSPYVATMDADKAMPDSPAPEKHEPMR